MNLFGITISKTPADADLKPGELPVFAVLHDDGRVAYLGSTEQAAEDVIRNSPYDKLYVIKFAARPIRPV